MYYKKYHLLASVAVIALGVGFSHGAVQAASGNYWREADAVDDNFFNPYNWTLGIVPDGYDTYFYNGTAHGNIDDLNDLPSWRLGLPEIIGSGSENVADVTISISNSDLDDQDELRFYLGEEFKLGTHQGTGVLTVDAKGPLRLELKADSFVIGDGEGATGTLNLFGEGKNLENIPEGPHLSIDEGDFLGTVFSAYGDSLTIGNDGGTGTLNIKNAGFYLDEAADSPIVIGTGKGSKGELNLLSNGKLAIGVGDAQPFIVGDNEGTGRFNIIGDGNQLDRSGAPAFVSGSGFTVGNNKGEGELNLLSKGKIHNFIDEHLWGDVQDGDYDRSIVEARLGVNDGKGTATVSGEGAVWYVSGNLGVFDEGELDNEDYDAGNLHVGYSGDGELIIADQGQVRIGTGFIVEEDENDDDSHQLVDHVSDGKLILGTETSGTGVLSIGGGVGQSAKAAGRLMAQTLEFGEGEGTVRFNHTENDYVFDQFDSTFLKFEDDSTGDDKLDLRGGGKLDAAAGRTILNEDHLNFTGLVKTTTGIMQVNGDLSAATGKIDKGGALEGIGSIGNVVNAGILAPGKALNDLHGGDYASIGTFTIKGDYTGKNGFIYIDTVLGGDNSETDLLVIEGDTSGNSLVQVTNINGNGAQTNNGIKIIQVDGESNGDFKLNSDYKHNQEAAVVAGAFAYKLFKGGKTDQNEKNWYLRSELNETKRQYQAGAPVYEVYPQFLLGLSNLPTMQQRVGNLYWNNAGNMVIAQGADAVEAYAPAQEAGSLTQTNGVWGRIEGAHTKMEPNTSTTDANYDFNAYKMQAGLDGMVYENEQGKLIAGGTVHYTHGLASIWSPYDVDLGRGRIKTDGYGFGATLTWASDDGFYVDNQAQLTWYRSELSYAGGKSELKDGKNNGFGYALSSEVGKRFTLDQHWSLTPQAQLQYSNVDFSDFTDVFGADVSRKKGDSLRARLGLSVDYQNSWQNAQGMTDRSSVYGIVNLYNEFLSGTKVRVSTEDFINKSERFWGGIGFGGSYNWDNDKYSIYGEGSVNTSFKNFGDSYNYQGTLGVRVKW